MVDHESVAESPRTVRVLIADDQESFRSAARLVIELTDGFDVVGEAASGDDAVRLATELAPDLVLMDIKMAGIDGLEATRRIVRDHPGLRVVALSTYEEYVQHALDAGAVAFVAKSDFDAQRLLTVWESAR